MNNASRPNRRFFFLVSLSASILLLGMLHCDPCNATTFPSATSPTINLGSSAIASQEEFEQRTLLTTVPTGVDFEFDLTRLMDPGNFSFVSGPDGFKISSEGVTGWYPGNGFNGQEFEIKFKVDRAGKESAYAYKLHVSRGRPQVVLATGEPSPIAVDKATFDWYPVSLKQGELFKASLVKFAGKGKFLLLDGPGNLNISTDGAVEWGPRNGDRGVQKVIIQQVMESNEMRFIYLQFLVESEPKRKIQSALKTTLASNGVKKSKSATTVLECPKPAGWVMLQDGSTLIVSNPSEAELIYFDTTEDVEIKRVEVDFQPNALALQGDKLFASSVGAAVVYVLDPETGELLQEISTGSDAVVRLACHPKKGNVYASTVKFEIFSIDGEQETATKTVAKGHFLAVDPKAGAFVYAGFQPNDRPELLVEITEDENGTLMKFHYDDWGARAVLMKYKVAGQRLKLVGSQDNAAVNGWWMHLSPDGERIMLVGGGGWRPKDEGVGGGYITAIFKTSNLEERVGQLPVTGNVIFHPVLKMGVINDKGWQLIPFRDKSFTLKPAIVVNEDLSTNREKSLLVFGGKGSKIVFWNGSNISEGKGVHFIPLVLTDKEKEQLADAYR